MTAVPDWGIVDARHTDAELVRASLAGDQAAFAQMYDRYANRLHDFCVGMLRDRDGAADCVQDAFCVAATRLSQLREPDKLRPWLYSIARNEALRALSERRRESPSDAVPDEMSDEPGPETLAARSELADLISEAAGGLSDRERTVLQLAYHHGLNGPELATALGVTHTNANTMLVRLRDTIERSLGALLVARHVRNSPAECAELADLLHGWDGQFNVLMRKRVSRHIESCPNCDAQRHRMVSPTALLGGVPALIPAPAGLRGHTLDKIRLTPSEAPVVDAAAQPTESNDEPEKRRSSFLPFVLLVAGLIGAIAAVTIWVHQQNLTPINPVNITATTPTPLTGAGPGKSPGSETPSVAAPSTTPTTTLSTVSPPPAQTTVTIEPSARPELPPLDKTPPVRERTPKLVPVAPPPPPPDSKGPESMPRTPVTTQRPTGIAGVPNSPAPTTKRRVVDPAPKPPPRRATTSR